MGKRLRVTTWYVTIVCPSSIQYVEKVKAISREAAIDVVKLHPDSGRHIKSVTRRAPRQSRTGTSALRKRRSATKPEGRK